VSYRIICGSIRCFVGCSGRVQASLRVQLQERTDPRYGMTLAARCCGSPEGCFESGVTTAGGRGAADGLVSGVLFAARRQVASSPSGTGWQAGQRAPARRYRRSTWNLGVHMPGARKRRLGSQKAHDPEELVMSYRRCIQHPGPETPLQWPGLWSEEDVSSPQGSVCDGLPRIRDSKHCRPPDRSIREPSNPSLGAPGRYRSSVPEGCGAGDGLASGGLLAARRTTHSSSHQTRAGKRAKRLRGGATGVPRGTCASLARGSEQLPGLGRGVPSRHRG